MLPSSSQVYLAVDILSTEPSPRMEAIHASARETLATALATPGWSGKTEACSEYGRPPTSFDPEAQESVRTIADLRRHMSTTHATAPTELLHTEWYIGVQAILDGAR